MTWQCFKTHNQPAQYRHIGCITLVYLSEPCRQSYCILCLYKCTIHYYTGILCKIDQNCATLQHEMPSWLILPFMLDSHACARGSRSHPFYVLCVHHIKFGPESIHSRQCRAAVCHLLRAFLSCAQVEKPEGLRFAEVTLDKTGPNYKDDTWSRVLGAESRGFHRIYKLSRNKRVRILGAMVEYLFPNIGFPPLYKLSSDPHCVICQTMVIFFLAVLALMLKLGIIQPVLDSKFCKSRCPSCKVDHFCQALPVQVIDQLTCYVYVFVVFGTIAAVIITDITSQAGYGCEKKRLGCLWTAKAYKSFLDQLRPLQKPLGVKDM